MYIREGRYVKEKKKKKKRGVGSLRVKGGGGGFALGGREKEGPLVRFCK